MQVDLDKTFPVEAPASSSWQVLSDINTVASCMPGAEVTGQVDETNYTGKVKSKIGPATMAFDGTIEILGIDEAIRVPGMIHGVLFCLFAAALYWAWQALDWPIKRAALVFVCALIPFAPFFIEASLKREHRRLNKPSP